MKPTKQTSCRKMSQRSAMKPFKSANLAEEIDSISLASLQDVFKRYGHPISAKTAADKLGVSEEAVNFHISWNKACFNRYDHKPSEWGLDPPSRRLKKPLWKLQPSRECKHH